MDRIAVLIPFVLALVDDVQGAGGDGVRGDVHADGAPADIPNAKGLKVYRRSNISGSRFKRLPFYAESSISRHREIVLWISLCRTVGAVILGYQHSQYAH